VRRDLPSGTVTFLFTDVEGSTKLLHSLGAEGYAEALAEHRRLIREACARYIARLEEAEAVQRYIRSYTEMPETESALRVPSWAIRFTTSERKKGLSLLI